MEGDIGCTYKLQGRLVPETIIYKPTLYCPSTCRYPQGHDFAKERK